MTTTKEKSTTGKRDVCELFLMMLLIFFLAISGSAQATEGGGSVYPGGNDDFFIGMAPPPGSSLLNYTGFFNATKLKDNAGRNVPIDFNVDVVVDSMRYIYVTEKKFDWLAGGQLLFHVVEPFLYVHGSVAGMTDTKTGLGDTSLGLYGMWNYKNFHWCAGIDATLPTGRYNKDDLINLGRNYYAIQPMVTTTYFQNGWQASGKWIYNFNTVNPETHYVSGQEFILDWALGKTIGPWTFGVNGVVYKQMTDDTQNGSTVGNGNRAQAFSAGPAILYSFGKWGFITAKYQQEFEVKNRPEYTKLWIKVFHTF